MDGARYLEDGKLTIFPPSRHVLRSPATFTGEICEEMAVQAGRRLLFQLEQRTEQGLPPKSNLFTAVIDDYIRFRERDLSDAVVGLVRNPAARFLGYLIASIRYKLSGSADATLTRVHLDVSK